MTFLKPALATAATFSALLIAGCGDITPSSAIADFCSAKSSADSTEQTCIGELEGVFVSCREGEKARNIDFQDTNCLDEARDSWDH